MFSSKCLVTIYWYGLKPESTDQSCIKYRSCKILTIFASMSRTIHVLTGPMTAYPHKSKWDIWVVAVICISPISVLVMERLIKMSSLYRDECSSPKERKPVQMLDSVYSCPICKWSLHVVTIEICFYCTDTGFSYILKQI